MIEPRQRLIERITGCPECSGPLLWESEACRCPRCKKRFCLENGQVDFLGDGKDGDLTPEVRFNQDLLEGRSAFSRFVRVVRRVVTSEYQPVNHLARTLERMPPDSVIVEFGSGSRRLDPGVVNLDRVAFDNVDLVCDIRKAPIQDNTVDLVVMDTVLEHVAEPGLCVDQAYRILRKGGRVVCIAPFIFPYHSYPRHYWNFSEDGLQYLFRRFSACNVMTGMGPTSGLINLVSEYVSLGLTSGTNPVVTAVMKGACLLPLFVFKYLDVFWARLDRSRRIAMCLVAVSEK